MSDTAGLDLDPRAAIASIAATLGLEPGKVAGAVGLLLAGNTVPFVARYRKEQTGGLDDAQVRAVEQALAAERELTARKDTVLRTIAEQGKLDAALRARILATRDRRELEDLYLPFRPKRRTRAAAARERGLGPLAAILREQRNPAGTRAQVLAPFVSAERGVGDADAALLGACDILAEEWAETPEHRRWMRREMERGSLASRKRRGYTGDDGRFEGYYAFQEPVARIASHRFLALRRGEAEGALSLAVELDDARLAHALARQIVRNPGFVFRPELERAAADSYERLLRPSIASELLATLKERADAEAITVFARNLGELLLAPPAGTRVVLGVDPGFRSGCKLAVVDATGRVLEHATVSPTPPRAETGRAAEVLRGLVERHRVELVAIGNGTGAREADAFVAAALAAGPAGVQRLFVSEAGASVYSASEVARAELPELDVTIRGAVSIARRVQDPLAELVKIDPAAIGVGQYQHDVDEAALKRSLDAVVETCVNRVGVDLNTASPALLGYVAGIGPRLAAALVHYREAHGAFGARAELRAVPRFGARAFEQSAGFLRVRDGREPLDASAVHPERYPVVGAMAKALGLRPAELVGDAPAVARLRAEEFVRDGVGLPTVSDILEELARPGRDPRREFRVARFTEGVATLADLRPGMRLEGVVTNVTGFGAFVDVGVHQDGLVHLSELDTRFVKDPATVVKVGDILTVVVLEVDARRGRIALSRKRALT